MRRVYALSFLLFVLWVVGLSSRAEASVVNIFLPTYIASGAATGGDPPSSVNFSQTSDSPVSFSQGFSPAGSLFVSAGGAINPGGGGFFESEVSIHSVESGSGSAHTTINFDISEPSEIDLICSAIASVGIGSAFFSDLTTGQTLLGCFPPFGPMTGSGSFLLNPTDIYQLSTVAFLNVNDDFNSGSLTFQIPGVTDVNIFLPEPSVICLLGIALIPLGLLHRARAENSRGRSSIASWLSNCQHEVVRWAFCCLTVSVLSLTKGSTYEKA